MLRGRAAKSDLRQTRSAEDVPEVVTALRRRGVEVAVIGDIHVDLRPAFAGLQPLIDTFTLSCEQSMQEPDPGIFRQAPNGLGVTAAAALMVCDHSRPDTAAVEHGITTLLLPPLQQVTEHRPGMVLAVCDLMLCDTALGGTSDGTSPDGR